MKTKEVITKKTKIYLSNDEWEDVSNGANVISNLLALLHETDTVEIGGAYYSAAFIQTCMNFLNDIICVQGECMTVYPEDFNN